MANRAPKNLIDELAPAVRGVSRPLSEQCADNIVRGIRSGRYRPCTRLGEATVAMDLKVGKAQVRSAFDMLTYAGILERRPRSGTYIRQFSLDDIRELRQVRGTLEGLAARSACLRLSEKQLDSLKRLAHRLDPLMCEEPYNNELTERLDLEFHTTIIGACDNKMLIGLVGNQRFLMDCLHTEVEKTNLFPLYGHRVPSHGDVVESLRLRNPAKAEKVLRQHIIDSWSEYLKVMQARTGQAAKPYPTPH